MLKSGIAFIAAASIFAVGGSVANATDGAQQTCTSMATQTRDALQGNRQSSNYGQARKESEYGRDFCNNGMPKQGIEHYAQALKLLGITAS